MSTPGWLVSLHSPSNHKKLTCVRLLVAAASGALLSLSYTGYYLSIFAWTSVALLLLAALSARPRAAYACGFLHGLFFVLTSLSWIGEVLALHGGLSKAGGFALLLLFGTAWGVLSGGFCWCVNRLARQSLGLACVGAPFLWVGWEFARTHLPEIGFPWNLLGYPASGNLAFLQLTAATGIWGLSLVVAAINTLLVWVAFAKSPALRWRAAAFGAATATLVGIYLAGPSYVPRAGASHTARSMQLNLPETEGIVPDWFGAYRADMEEIVTLSLARSAATPDLLIWPEAPAPFSFQNAVFAQRASSIAVAFAHPFLFGTIEWKQPEEAAGGLTRFAPYNSALLLDAQGRRAFSYDKVHLVPFGEYEPFPLIHRVVSSVSSEVGGFRKGTQHNVGQLGDQKFAAFICYEAIFPGEVREFAKSGANLFINISNDGWFGKSAAAEQHIRMARVRAVENRRWILRSTNSGITASIDPYGRIHSPVGRDVRAAVDLPYDFRTDTTIYTRFGDWAAWLSVLISAILLLTTFRKAN
ncbi:MAG TPA: apolipoprotein N-acyltransferase [Candidatus Saccharimonadales bacterium]|nr:apolipoprotein N-acyltransferase [Candidatus Saccharimonadales bacterium]